MRKKIGIAIMAIFIAAACAFGISACSGVEEKMHVHSMTHHAEVPATCVAQGSIEYWQCDECGKIFSDEKGEIEVTDITTPIDKNNHDLIHYEKKEATCFEAGYEAYDECRLCDYTTFSGVTLDKHNYVDDVCTVCGAKNHYTDGLEYSPIKYKNGLVIGYEVSDKGTATDREIVIPTEYDGKPVTSVGENAFALCDKLTSIEMPKSVRSIGAYAFNHCSRLKNIAIPDSVTSIGDGAFYKCSALTSIEIPKSLISLGNGVFYQCSKLTSIEIPAGVTDIGGGVFYNCGNLTDIRVDAGNAVYHSSENCLIETASKTLLSGCKNSIIPADGSVTVIGVGAFAGFGKLTDIEIPNSVVSIENYAFFFCGGLNSINIPDSVTTIGEDAFSYCSGLTSVVIPNSVVSIGDGAFIGCSSLKSIEIPNSITYIGFVAFAECDKLTNIAIPDSVTSIGAKAFVSCDSLTKITIPDSVTNIGQSAFSHCRSLSIIEIPSSVTSIGERAFSECGNIESIIFNGTVEQWSAIEKGFRWDSNAGEYTVTCTDGKIDKDGTLI